ncbi:MAG: hypothetical protein ACFFBD_29715, partial [Candidatus Hodarchaeota archaeon]
NYRVYANLTVDTTVWIEGYSYTILGSIFIELIWNKPLGVLEKEYLEITGFFIDVLSTDIPKKLVIERGEVPVGIPGFETAILVVSIGLITILTLVIRQKRS